MNYGMPYMGSKSKIVHLIGYVLERHYDKDYFIDLFCGGFAVSHYVMQKSSKIKILANDKNKYVVALLKKVLYDGLPDLVYDFITRDKFFDVIENPDNYDDWYVGYVSTIWSFGNVQTYYLFGKDVEPIKHAIHKAIIENVWDEIVKDIEKEVPEEVKSMNYKKDKEKRLIFMRYVKNYLKGQNNKTSKKRLEQLQQIHHLQNLERLQGLEQLQRSQQLQRLEPLQSLDWREFIDNTNPKILKNAIIYCDPPYEDTKEYSEKNFSHDEFWQWFRETPYCVYVSSYKAPDDIPPLNFEFKNQLFSGGVGKKVKENIYWNGKGNAIPTMEDLLFNT